MRLRITQERRFFIIMLIALIMMVITAVFTYRNLDGIVDQVVEQTKLDTKLLIMQDILSDQNEAESKVALYKFSNDTDYVKEFFFIREDVSVSLKKLIKQTDEQPSYRNLIDSFKILSNARFDLQGEMILNYSTSDLAEDIQKIKNQVKRTASIPNKKPTQPTSNNVNSEDKLPLKSKEDIGEEDKGSFFDKVFKKKKERESKEIKTSPLKEPVNKGIEGLIKTEPESRSPTTPIKISNGELNQITAQLDSLTVKTKKLAKESSLRELELSSRDKKLKSQLSRIIIRVERRQNQDYLFKANMANDTASRTRKLVTFLIALISALLVLLTLGVVRYMRNGKEYSKALKIARNEAVNLAKAKESFLANMSHEIRTPLNAIYGFTEQALDSNDPQKVKESLVIVKEASSHLRQLIENILDLSKLEVGKIEIAKEPVQIINIIEEVVSILTMQTKQKGLRLHFVKGDSVPEFILSDEIRIRQVLFNVIGNAIKFTEKGKVEIYIEAVELLGTRTFRIIISDTGKGIADSDLKNIFGEFEQANNNIYKEFGGTGLGLAITKRIIDLMGGKIEVESELGKGSSFILEFPFEEAEEVKKSNKNNDENQVPLELGSQHILICDDQSFNRKLIANILEKWGLNYTECKDGQEAVELVVKENFDLILMDLRMPNLRGDEASKIIRKSNSQVPIVAVSAAISDSAKASCLDSGMNGFLEKPFGEAQLKAVLLGQLSNKPKPVFESKTVTNKLKNEIDIEPLVRISNNDNKFVIEMLELFQQQLKNGISELSLYLEKSDFEGIADLAHSLSGPSAQLKLVKLVQQFKTLEKESKTLKSHEILTKLYQEIVKDAKVIDKQIQKTIQGLK